MSRRAGSAARRNVVSTTTAARSRFRRADYDAQHLAPFDLSSYSSCRRTQAIVQGRASSSRPFGAMSRKLYVPARVGRISVENFVVLVPDKSAQARQFLTGDFVDSIVVLGISGHFVFGE